MFKNKLGNSSVLFGAATGAVILFGTVLGLLGIGGQPNEVAAKTMAVRVETNHQLKSAITVESNGKNALFNKAGTLKHARVVAGKQRLATMGNSDSSKHYFRAYRVARLSNGLVYYKMVSFDGKYRGWIYGGKSTTKVAGGIKRAATVTKTAVPNAATGHAYRAGQTVWGKPKWSVYKNKLVAPNTTQYLHHDLRILDAKRLTREGTVYYYVQNLNDSTLNGWVRSDGIVDKT
ncbi:hypothetical protein [Secundilactobacillus similis]|uniref:S-layer protein n=1 Tax=Secundilactobacillus similis DSM 23365 = JCM 2765 TaxID=1423804 RepID=A0A0R2FMZ8_9LACO|nr:hypothetical protein [Secundilactobacillus similis]KRN26220.1 hypothetical protein FD14_GL002563 [Secundilactobacillus similis DSM 23365 = JCM 2765]